MADRNNKSPRAGGIYIAVLGTSLMVALLGLAALTGQRLQNRMLVAATDIRQAELNANTAVELALLTMKQDTNWRTTNANGNWFTNRGTALGTCSLNVTDPIDADLANNADDPVVVLGIGNSGQAEQRVRLTVDPGKEPISSLRSAVAAGDLIDLQGDWLRAPNALITANQVSATTSQVLGNVEAISISGSTYYGTTTQITSDKRPTMPDWTTVFSYYLTNGTQLNIGSLPTSTPNLGRNVGIENGETYWTGTPPGVAAADIDQSNNQAHSGTYSLRVRNPMGPTAGAAQHIDSFVKPNQQYVVEVWVYLDDAVAGLLFLSLHTKGTGGAAQSSASASVLVLPQSWIGLSATLTAPTWTGDLEYAYVKVGGVNAALINEYFVDDLLIRETTTGRFIYRQVLSPSVNTLYTGAPTNSQGIYWIDCGNQRLVIERSRILGTLLVVNPGANSCVSNGPINWSPAVAGFPALLVDADTATNANFSLNATSRLLSEVNNDVNFNPTGVPYDFGPTSLCTTTDSSINDVYPSEIRGLVVVRNDLTYQNRCFVRGQVIVGDDIANSSGELEVEYQRDSLLNPPPGFWAPYSYLRRPASAEKVVLP